MKNFQNYSPQNMKRLIIKKWETGFTKPSPHMGRLAMHMRISLSPRSPLKWSPVNTGRRMPPPEI